MDSCLFFRSTLSDADFGSNIYGRVSAFLGECNAEHVRFCPEQFAEMIRTLSDELVRKVKDEMKFRSHLHFIFSDSSRKTDAGSVAVASRHRHIADQPHDAETQHGHAHFAPL